MSGDGSFSGIAGLLASSKRFQFFLRDGVEVALHLLA